MCIANPSKNPRPNRIINLLTQKGYSVDTIAYKSDGNLNIFNENILEEDTGYKYIRVDDLSWSGFFDYDNKTIIFQLVLFF